MALRPVPSAFTGEQATYLNEVVAAINAMPVFSFFSGLTPESVVTGVSGNFAFNPFSASTTSLYFVKWGSSTVASKVSWCTISLRTVA